MDIAASMSIYKKSDQTFPALWNCLLFHFSGQIFPRSNRKPAASGCLLAFGFVLLTLQKVQIFQKNCLLFLHSCEQVNSEKSLVVIHCVTSVRCCLLWSVLVTQNSDHDQKPKSLKQTYLDLRIDTVVNFSTDFGVASYLPKPLSNIKIKKQIFEFFLSLNALVVILTTCSFHLFPQILSLKATTPMVHRQVWNSDLRSVCLHLCPPGCHLHFKPISSIWPNLLHIIRYVCSLLVEERTCTQGKAFSSAPPQPWNSEAASRF